MHDVYCVAEPISADTLTMAGARRLIPLVFTLVLLAGCASTGVGYQPVRLCDLNDDPGCEMRRR